MKHKVNIQIVIDSSVYRKDDVFISSNLKQITELGKLGLITIHIPWFVYKECTSGFTDTLNKELDKSIFGIDTFNAQIRGVEDSLLISKSKEELLERKKCIEQFVHDLWKKYISESKAKLIEFDKSKSKTVFENYFKGNRPFSSLKNRKDIPDAFIFQELESISKFDMLYFISEDGNLLKEAAKLPKVICYNGLDSFYSSTHYTPIKQEYDTITEYKESLAFVLGQKQLMFDSVDKFLKEEGLKFFFEDVYIPSNSNEGTLIQVNKITDIKLSEENIKHINNTFYLPVEVHADGLVEYFRFHSDAQIKLMDFYNQSKKGENYDSNIFLVPLIISIEVTVNLQNNRQVSFGTPLFIRKVKVDSDLIYRK
jgi:hypothetical protein